MAVGFMVVLVLERFIGGARPDEELAVLANVLLVFIGQLLVAVKAPTALAEERVRGSLDVLLSCGGSGGARSARSSPWPSRPLLCS
jgi:hypothetical protein